MRVPLPSALCVLLLAACPAAAQSGQAAQQAALRQLVIHDAAGVALDTAHHPGRVLVVDFWAWWCPNCLREMEGMTRLRADLGGSVEIALVSSRKDWDRDRAYAQAHGLPFHLYVYEPAEVHVQAAALQGEVVGNAVRMLLPTAAVFMPDGRLAIGVQGAHDWSNAALEQDLRAMARP